MVIYGYSCITCRKATIPFLDSSSASCFWFRCRLFSVSPFSHVIAADANVARFFVRRQPGRKLCARNLGPKVLNSCSLFSLAWFHHIYGCMERVRGIHHCQKRPIRHHLASQHPSRYTCLCSSRLPYIERDWLRPIQARTMRCHLRMGDCFLLVGGL